MSDGRVECTLLWFIENYRYCWQKKGEGLYSPYLTVDELERTSWRIKVYPRGRIVENKGWVSLCLNRNKEDGGPETVSVNLEISVLAEDGSTLRSRESKRDFKKGNVGGWGWPCFIEIEDVPEGTLTLRCRIWTGEGKVRKVAPIFARTRISVENISFLHVVENFSTLKQDQKKTIETRSHSKNGFVLSSSLHVTYDSISEGEMILEITPSDSNHILWKRKVSLIDASGNMISCGENGNRSDAERKDIQIMPLSLTRQAILIKMCEYLPDDKLYLFCECSFSTGLEFEKIEGAEYQKSVPVAKEVCNPIPSNHEDYTVGKASAYPSALEDMKTLYMNQCLTDVELKTKTKSFPAHKSVLAARSPVFEAMFSTDMKEKYKKCIEIDDLTDDTVQQMLLFLYSDKVENLQWKSASKLYYASDKYEVGKLKEICSSFLVGNLTANNAGELLVLADTHSDGDLKKSVEDFILEHEEQVFGTKEWETLIETNPLLVIKTMHLKYKKKNEQKTDQENKRYYDLFSMNPRNLEHLEIGIIKEMDLKSNLKVTISSNNTAFEIKIKDFRSATEPLRIWVEFVHTDSTCQYIFIIVIIPNYVENAECWLAFDPRSAMPRALRNDKINVYLCCTVSIVDVEEKSSFQEYFEVPKPETPEPTMVPKYLKKSFILERGEEFLPDGVLTLRVDFIFDSRYIDMLDESDSDDEQYWSRSDYLFSHYSHRIQNKDTSEPQRDTFRGDSSYELRVYDFTCKILKLPQFHEARRRFGVYGIPPKEPLLSSELEVNPDIFEHVWIFDIKDENQIFLHRFLVSFDEREDSVGTRLLRASSVLRRMVNAPMREQQEKRIEFLNINCHLTFYYTLEFLARGELTIYDLHNIVDIYKFSHLYEMEELQRKCAESMAENSEHESELEELERISEHYQDRNLSELLKLRRQDYGTPNQFLFRTGDVPNSDCYI